MLLDLGASISEVTVEDGTTIDLIGPTYGNGTMMHKLVMAKDAAKLNGTFPRTSEYIEECQYPEALDPIKVLGKIVICNFSTGFYTQKSTLAAVINTAKTLGFEAFVLVASPSFGDYIAEPLTLTVSGILIPRVADAKVILEFYEEQTKRDERGNAIEFGALAALGEGRIASYKGRSPVVSRFSSRGPDIIDAQRNPADVLKPDIIAPGYQIWAAWTPFSAIQPMLKGHHFALLSGTSMATPHVAGIAALIKQQNPSWTPSIIASAISTTSTKHDNLGQPLMAQGFEMNSLHTSTPFEHGLGFVNPSRAIDLGLVFSSGHEDFINFLCSLPNIDQRTMFAATGEFCWHSFEHPFDLNLPSVTISALRGSVSVRRTVINIGNHTETYLASVLPPNGTTVNLNPNWFTISPMESQDLDIQFSVVQPGEYFSFGEIVLTGSLDHIVRITLSVRPVSVY